MKFCRSLNENCTHGPPMAVSKRDSMISVGFERVSKRHRCRTGSNTEIKLQAIQVPTQRIRFELCELRGDRSFGYFRSLLTVVNTCLPKLAGWAKCTQTKRHLNQKGYKSIHTCHYDSSVSSRSLHEAIGESEK